MQVSYTPRTVLVDIDGTLADLTHRRVHVATKPKNWKKFFERMDLDQPIGPIVHLVQTLHAAGNTIIFCSGRNRKHERVTRQWLSDHVGEWTWGQPIYMRNDNDHRADDIVKEELLAKIREAGFTPTLALMTVIVSWPCGVGTASSVLRLPRATSDDVYLPLGPELGDLPPRPT
jgi:hypothetical protein